MSRIPDSPSDSPAASTPPPVADAPGSPQHEGRDEHGRFTKGNRGGFGNPFARRTAAFRCALLEAVTEEMIAAVVHKLVEQALTGDVAAIKLLLAYTVGKPGPAVNPDTLDVEEYRQYLQEPADLQPLARIATRPSLDLLLETVRGLRPGLDEACAHDFARRLDEMDQAAREAECEPAEQAATAEADEDTPAPESQEEAGGEPTPPEEEGGARPASAGGKTILR